jgi:hypothetical protein
MSVKEEGKRNERVSGKHWPARATLSYKTK